MAVGRKTGGRKAGTPNKLPGDIKHMVVAALAGVGGQAYLERQAEQNPVAFMGLVGRVLPLQVTGEGGGPLLIITGVRRELEERQRIDDDESPRLITGITRCLDDATTERG